jgi:hypothetical protein
MQVVDISGFHNVTQLPEAGKDYQLTPYTKTDELVTIQSIFIKAPTSNPVEIIFKTQRRGGQMAETMNIGIAMNSTKVINVKQQLPEAFCMFASASVPGASITLNGVVAKLG